MDASSLTSIGLGQIARPTQLLQVPGILQNGRQLTHVREKLAADFQTMFAQEGYTLLGWGDAGSARYFAKKPILNPEDLKSARPWVPRDDVALPEMMRVIGANGVPLGIPEVFAALQTGMVDAVTVSAIAAVALQVVDEGAARPGQSPGQRSAVELPPMRPLSARKLRAPCARPAGDGRPPPS